ncbi:site-specific integrase [Halosquirtibacter laminarini]|uniref:Site-specific integrase n=1 Tax=Halosquirtibacter laminarini TaxID=3374600 RepID=A0AC61NPU9_9BACT|nr:site-specific integrase [Prolixibacteraceae bacterium]
MKARYSYIYNRKNKLNKQGTALIQICVYFKSRQRAYISTGIYIRPEEWNDKDKCICKNPNSIKMNHQIRSLRNRIEDKEMELLDRGACLSPQILEEFLLIKQSGNRYDFIQFCENYNKKDNSVTVGTYKARNTGIANIKKHNKMRVWADINLKNIVGFDNYLHKQGYKIATIGKQHSYLKLFINAAIKEGYLNPHENPYMHFKICKKDHSEVPRYIKPEEIEKIKAVALPYETGELSKDLFLFSCYTGIAYSDVMTLTQENLLEINNRPVIKKKRQKTKEEFIVPILLLPQHILKKYKDNERETLFPSISNQKYNKNLKRIADAAGIKEKLTTHVARHTFASIFLNSGGRIETLQRILGHADINSTQVYAKIFDETVLNEMDLIEK